MLTYILQVTICLAAFYGLYVACLRRETFFRMNRWYLLSTLALSLCLPLLTLAPLHGISATETSIPALTLQPVVIGIQDMSMSVHQAESSPGWMILLCGIYWTGVCVLLIRFINGLFSLYKLYQSGARVTIRNTYHCIITPDATLPFSFFQWIFLPKEPAFQEDALDEILTHESAHARAWHSVDVLFTELACILLWPSPMIYFYRRSLKRVHEYLADAAVLRHTPVIAYGHLLLSHTGRSLQPLFVHQFFQSQLKDRIMMMTKDKSRRSAMLKYIAGIPVAMLVFTLFAFQQRGAIPDTPVAAGISDTVYTVVEEMPRFPGCEDSGLSGSALFNCSMNQLLDYIYHHVQYPEEAKKAGISGRVIAQFTILHDGNIADATILSSPGHGTAEAVLDVINALPKWRPGYQHGEAVNVQFTLPVSFKLDSHAGNSADTPSNPYVVVDEMPRFPGCEDSGMTADELNQCAQSNLITFIRDHLRYPQEAKEAGVEGRGVVQFVVKADGTISDPKAIRTIGYGTDKVMLDMVNAMPAWRPGYQDGKAVDVEMTLPIAFVLPKAVSSQDTPAKQSAADDLRIAVFPMPPADKLNYTLDLPAGNGTLVIDLLSPDGQSLRHVRKTLGYSTAGNYSGSFDMGDLSAGTYVMRVQWGDHVTSQRVVVQ